MVKKIGGVIIAIVGFAGLPDDLITWSRWIDKIMYDPRVIELAQRAVELSEFINQWWVRGLLVVGGLLLTAWAWRPFWRLRHKWIFRWRRLVSEQVWILQDDAIKLMKESSWGRLKEPNVIRTVSVLDGLAFIFIKERTVYGLPDTQKKLLKFEAFLEKTLHQFCNSNPSACRIEEGVNQIDENALRNFLRMAMDEEISDEFGEVPDFKVT